MSGSPMLAPHTLSANAPRTIAPSAVRARSLFAWRYRRKPKASDANKETGDTEEAPALSVPYAVAICIGALWTVWLFYERGFPMPF